MEFWFPVHCLVFNYRKTWPGRQHASSISHVETHSHSAWMYNATQRQGLWHFNLLLYARLHARGTDLRQRGEKNDIRVSGGRVTNILGDDYLHECYESMHSRVDKSTVNVKLIASCCGHMSFKRKRWTIPCCKRSEVIGRSDSLSPLEILIKVLETSCFREYKCVLCWFMQKTGVQIKDR